MCVGRGGLDETGCIWGVEEVRLRVATVTAPLLAASACRFNSPLRVESIPALIKASKSGWRQAAGIIYWSCG